MKDTLEVLGWGNPARLVLRAGAPLIVVFLGAYVLGASQAIARAQWLLFGATVSVSIFLILLALYFIGTPHRLDRELTEERDAIQGRLARWQDTEAVGRRLEDLWRRGATLRDAPDRDNPIWKSMVIEWFGIVDGSERDNLPGHEQFMLESIMPPPHDNESSSEVFSKFVAKLENLRRVVSRMLTPPGELPGG